MDVVSDTCSVRSGIITPKDIQMGPLPNNNLLDIWEQIIGMNVWLIPKQITWMGPTRIEVSQWNDPPTRLHLRHRAQQHLNACLGFTIGTSWVDRVSLFAVIFVTVDTCTGREDEVFAIFVFFHHFEQVHWPDHIVLVIEDGFLVAFPDGLFGSKMHDPINRCLFGLVESKQIVQGL